MNSHNNHTWIETVSWSKIFLIVVFVQIILQFMFNYLVLSDENIYYWYYDTLDDYQIEDVINKTKTAAYFSYIVILTFSILRIVIYSTTLYTAILLNEELKIESSIVLKICTWAEMAVIFRIAIKLIYFLVTTPDSIESLSNAPFSLSYFLGLSKNDGLTYIITKQINVFEIITIAWYSYSISKVANVSFEKSMLFILPYYLFILFSWIAILALIQ